MSDFLLQKSYKLFSESKGIKRARKSELQKLRKKKNYNTIKKIDDQKSEKNLSQNLQKLHRFNEDISVTTSREGLLKHDKEDCQLKVESEEATVFTDKDFEEFEREYCDS